MHYHYKVEYFTIFEKVYYSQSGQSIVIPELWKSLDWDNDNYLKELSKYVSSNFHSDIYNSSYLYIKNLSFFDKLKSLQYFSIFTAIPIIERIEKYNEFYLSNLYESVLKELVFVGWNPKCYVGSALTDGIYPIYLINGNIIKNRSLNINININRFGLISTELDCLEICRVNNENNEYDENDFWYPTKLYVDKNTFQFINQ
ncbi:hypothetical protein E4T80_08590 [Muribacter muris]|uniref:Uncharacterized protein n=1 Tax=Muribacter muris TaxID=67855 RepID=A0A4Y9JVC3_9PAST|nr:hypothetical protein [Muribacter muris]MBF0785515.1 hypothetical protein [Muribacter muris]MBF0826555.1 hypothetical protein [Muribacter muris]TFV09242.1 hypothetical protein E4T80_08590 [Muribacter muris]